MEANIMDIVEFLKSIVDPTQAQVLTYLILANILTGVVGALAKGKFELVKVVEFWKRLGVVVGAYLIASLAAKGLADSELLRDVCWVALLAHLAGHIISNLKEWGLPVPDKLSRWIER